MINSFNDRLELNTNHMQFIKPQVEAYNYKTVLEFIMYSALDAMRLKPQINIAVLHTFGVVLELYKKVDL